MVANDIIISAGEKQSSGRCLKLAGEWGANEKDEGAAVTGKNTAKN